MAIVTANMGLTAWTGSNDLFNHTVLANNFSLLDVHDHTTGKGLPVPAEGLGPLSVISSKVGPGAITSDKLALLSVNATHLTNNSVTAAAISPSSVNQTKIGVLPGARVYSTTDFSIPNAADTTVPFNAARYVNSNIWTVGSPTRLIAPVNGVYSFCAGLKWDVGTTGTRTIKILLNGTTILSASDRSATGGVFGSVSTLYNLVASDYVELVVNQTQGAALLLKATDTTLPYLAMQWISS